MTGSPAYGQFRTRMIMLAVAVVLIVTLPFWMTRAGTQRALDAAAWVSHTSEVSSLLNELLFLSRDTEALVYRKRLGIEVDSDVAIFENNREAVEAAIDRLAQMTRDDPVQQGRIGELRAAMQGRLRLQGEATTAYAAGAMAAGDAAMVTGQRQFRIREIADQIVDDERAKLTERQEIAARDARQLGYINLGAMLAQLVLLGLVLLVSEREFRQRLVAERTSKRAAAQAQAIFETAREPIALIDADLNLVLHNDAFSELYGLEDAERDSALPIAEVGNGVWADPVLTQRLKEVVARDRELWDYEQRFRDVDGNDRVILLNARRMRLPDSQDRAVLITASDVTVLKRAEDSIRDLNRQLTGRVDQVTEVNRELEAFSYSVSHDLRAPLRHIGGFADKLKRHLGEAVDEKTAHYLRVISDSSARMATLIDDLLVYSRLGRGAMRLQPVDMQAVVEETRAIVMADAGERDIRWRIQPLPVVMGDENMMRAVWQNLLGNAVKYSAKREVAEIEVSYRKLDDGTLQFSVKDNGAGFDMAYADKLFGVFQRLHKASEYPGTGIGLASVRRILARHGGRIEAEAAPDAGATFRFTLPTSTT